MALVVEKFGGTSVAGPERIRVVADHVARRRSAGDAVVLVVSAMGSETDELLRMASDVASAPPGRELDMLITGGERKACALMAMAINDLGVPAASFTGSQAGFHTDSSHTAAKIVEITPKRVTEALADGLVPVVGGSQGVSVSGDVTFFGRGGSDTTAVALAHALGADQCEIFTDVPGVFSADPRVVAQARRMDAVSFDELLEMTASGCPKPAMRAVELARTYGVELHVRSAFSWMPGTTVTGAKAMERAVISAVTHNTGEAKMTVSGVADKPGVAARLFRALADSDVNVDMIVQNVSVQGITDISFTVPRSQVEASRAVAEGLVAELGVNAVAADDDIARVSLIGAGMQTNPGVAARMFETLADEGINIEMISTSAIRISCVVRAADAERAVAALHRSFELDVAPAQRPIGY
ncbi:MAG: aspartate kinase [Acidimicrobiaceae bacterium]|nr:aspartate kinase [Acidimicrobiaceae bacterium]MCY4176245.1 aspartate kinase [Acidimicrobiaceae bacterium]MCY4280225.1 aspartate kinase [Acidimicrobiaceae bacterium]MCY4293593.1 aspartate kinase [Acidimicrobiaceae bacterium]